jgi:hypothetical protein
MLGVPLEGLVNAFCDNSSVVLNSTQPASTLKKKHNAIAYHKVREAIASNMMHLAWVHSSKNLADMLTKPLPGPTLHALCEKVLYLLKEKEIEIDQSVDKSHGL